VFGANRGELMRDLPELVFGFERSVPEISESAFIAPTAQIVGAVRIGPEASVWYGCVLRGDVNSILVGARSNIQDGTIVHCSPGIGPTDIGSDVLVGHAALIHGCKLCDGSFVGMRAVVLNNAVVETGALVAAGALVTEGARVLAGEIWGGSPAKKIGELRPAAAEGMRASVQSYVDLGRRHKASLSSRRGSVADESPRAKDDGAVS
jgi:carbonic anhydrase/acetyltransferase-like protein (isoleucine patch superfamily)